MDSSTSGPTPDPGRAPRRVRAGLVALGVLAASTLVPVAMSAMAATMPASSAADQAVSAGVTSDSPKPPPPQVEGAKGLSNKAPCTAAGGAHCLAVDNKSDGRIQSWLLKVLNPETNFFDPVRCLSVPRDDISGTVFFPDVHLNGGQQFLLESHRDLNDCSGDMWAGQGFTMGGSDGDNYSFADFTAEDPDTP